MPKGKHKRVRVVNMPEPSTPPKQLPKTAPQLPANNPKVERPVAPEDTTPYINTTGMTSLFCYGTLNIHAVQRGLWGEAKEGTSGVLPDYELKLWANSSIPYIEKKFGEMVVGKVYLLNAEQLEATDRYETDLYERVTINTVGKTPVDVYVRNAKIPAETSVTIS